jgi:SAM-dependent methyltransferase
MVSMHARGPNQMPTPVAGAAYVESISRRGSDRRTRQAFQLLAMRLAEPGARLFEFGAGPGADARVYARQGFQVGAYDVDPTMCDYFERACRDEIERGAVALNRGSYADFLASKSLHYGSDVALVTANFAPFNLVADLGVLFEKLHSITAPGGKILASVLSPYFVGDLVYGWWWRNLRQFRRAGHFSVAGDQAPITRRSPADFATHALPHFTLSGAWPGRASAVRGARFHGTQQSRPPLRRASLATSRFMFLLFERND